MEKRKLAEYKLEENFIELNLYVKYNNFKPILHFDDDAFKEERRFPRNTARITGYVKIYNTEERLKKMCYADKKFAEEQITAKLDWEFEDIYFLCPVIFCYSDPKNHKIQFILYSPIYNLFSQQQNIKIKYEEYLPRDVIPPSDYDQLLWVREDDNEVVLYDPGTSTIMYSPVINSISYFLFKRNKTIIKIIFFDNQNQMHCIIMEKLENATDNIDNLGWICKDEAGFLANMKTADLAPLMSHDVLLKESFTMHLKLMKWQIYPDLDLDKIQSLKCLIIGAGTLGCNVARNLMGWGVINITFIDDGYVSYSNPSRQNLYIIENCYERDIGKAEYAARSLKKIFTFVNGKGIKLRIPEPGHPPLVSDETLKTHLEMIENEIREHDVVFLLTDSRESRWLPTLLAVKYNKLAICAAIGAESLMVIRHPVISQTPLEDETIIPSDNLGCYFCSDIICPTDSQKNISIDKKCSVTRIGASQIASAHAVELLMTLSQHPLKFECPSPSIIDEETIAKNRNSILGFAPHQIRYWMFSYSQAINVTKRFENCVACSKYIIEEYDKNGYSFIKDVCNDSSIIRNISKIDRLVSSTEEFIEIF